MFTYIIINDNASFVSFNPKDFNDTHDIPKKVYGYDVPLRTGNYIKTIPFKNTKAKCFKLKETKASALNKIARHQELVDMVNTYHSFIN